MNLTEIPQKALVVPFCRAKGQPLTCVVSLRHIACRGILVVAHFFNWGDGMSAPFLPNSSTQDQVVQSPSRPARGG